MEDKRVLILGAKGFSKLNCYDWNEASIPNIPDYDIVFISVQSLTNNLKQRFVQNQLKKDLLELLETNGILVALGCEQDLITSFKESNYSWCPIPIVITNKSGTYIAHEDSTFKEYFENVKKYSYYFEIPKNSLDGEYLYEYIVTNSVKNRHGKYIAAKMKFLRYKVKKVPRSPTGYNGTKTELTGKHESGEFIFLPSPTEITDVEAINVILNKYFNIYQKTLPPDFTLSIEVPGLSAVREKIENNLKDIDRLSQENKALREKEAELIRYIELIYETGIPLEEIVKIIFTDLGYKPKPPLFKEEFIVQFKDKTGIIECKGNNKSIKRDDFRQILEYTKEYEIDGRLEHKGILIGNAWRLLPIQERNKSGTPIFPTGKDGITDIAAKHDIALVSAVDLFDVFLKYLEGEMAAEDIMNKIFSAKGMVNFNS
jgi:hypothetical protein